MNFNNRKEYNEIINHYITSKNISSSILQEGFMEAIIMMIDSLNMHVLKDVEQLAYLMWNFHSDFSYLLNSRYLLKKISLYDFGKKLIENPPNDNEEYNTLAYYNCIKFIGQFTTSQEIYEICLIFLKGIDGKTGSNMLPSYVMHLMCYNSNVDTRNNPYKISPLKCLNKHSEFMSDVRRSSKSDCVHNFSRYIKDIKNTYNILCLSVSESKKNIYNLWYANHIGLLQSYNPKEHKTSEFYKKCLLEYFHRNQPHKSQPTSKRRRTSQ